jgi:CRISPR-associated endonuclease/helicase Cas3
MTNKFIAHLQNEKGDFHNLDQHLKAVGELAENSLSIANPNLSEIAKWAGLLHDLGKYRDEFQAYLNSEGEIASSKETHHAVYGAALTFKKATETRNMAWLPIAFAILAHHGKLHNKGELAGKFQEYETDKAVPPLIEKFEQELGEIPENLNDNDFLKNTLRLEFATRMIFSALVDADRYDTAYHANNWQNPEKIEFKPQELLEKLKQVSQEKSENAKKSGVDEKLINLRNKIFADCLKKAEEKSGFFSLTVPTGGAKTLSSMAFALKHAEFHGKRRVIVVIPFLSIIEQNAKEYRQVFGDEVVVENHSAIEIKENSDDKDDLNRLSLITENWDAPVIVTTSVQFIESLFSNRTSKCRKLHNIANSVVIFDEIQTLPAKLLEPLFSVWRELVENYGVTFVFSTATQPAFKKNDFNFTKGLNENELTEITEATEEIYKTLNRVNYEFKDFQTPKTWTQIGDEMKAEPQVMSVLNTRKHAFELWDELHGKLAEPREHGIYHLSSAMCAEHRLQTIETIKSRLKNGETCKVVSTQLVEAGVDLDFPVLFRAIAPLDSIVQAAGRCNREGKLEKGRVVVFTPSDNKIPSGIYRVATDETCLMLPNLSEEDLAVNHEIFADYFGRIYPRVSTGDEIQKNREQLNFKEVAKDAKVIDNEGIGVIVPFGKAKEIIEKIRLKNFRTDKLIFFRDDMRSLQRFMVNLYPKDFDYLKNHGQLQSLIEGKELDLFVVNEGSYHKELGVLTANRPTNEFYGGI